MQASTERRRDCSGPIALAGAPSCVLSGARWLNFKMFNFAIDCLLSRKTPGNKQAALSTPPAKCSPTGSCFYFLFFPQRYLGAKANRLKRAARLDMDGELGHRVVAGAIAIEIVRTFLHLERHSEVRIHPGANHE